MGLIVYGHLAMGREWLDVVTVGLFISLNKTLVGLGSPPPEDYQVFWF